MAALAGGDPGRLLAAVLQRVEREVGKPGDIVPGSVYAKDPALVARAVAVTENRLGQVKGRAFLGLKGRDAQADCLPAEGTSETGSARGRGGEQGVERLAEPPDRRVERLLAAGGAGAQ